MTTTELLAQVAWQLNQYGPDSPEVDRFIQAHGDNHEFVDLAELSRSLKRMLLSEGVAEPAPAAPPVAVGAAKTPARS
jgi:hypothetical protein